MNITIIGTGFVGVVSAAVYASQGHQVIGLDINEDKIAALKQSQVPFYEPNLEELLKEQQQQDRLTFTSDYQTAIKNAEVIIVAVGTPSASDGQADLTYVFKSCESLAPFLKPKAIVVIKSTVPPGTLDKIEKIISQKTDQPFYTASLPEFLKEGSAVQDTLHPDRIIIGAKRKYVFEVLEHLHQPFKAKVIKISPESAQMAKYAANAYLAMRITFANQIADLCEQNGADIEEVLEAIGLDQRIGSHYWYPGMGYGGSCFPKDVKELAAYSRSVGYENNLLNKINELNEKRIPNLMKRFGDKVGGWQNKTVAVLGLSFKPNTDDQREAPANKVIPILLKHDARVKSFDPMATWPLNQLSESHQQIDSLEDAVKDVDVIMALIEWPEIISFDYPKPSPSQEKYFIDARNQFEPDLVRKWGYEYIGIGKS